MLCPFSSSLFFTMMLNRNSPLIFSKTQAAGPITINLSDKLCLSIQSFKRIAISIADFSARKLLSELNIILIIFENGG